MGAATLARLDRFEPFPVTGRVTRVSPSEIDASGPDCAVGEHGEIRDRVTGAVKLRARVAAVSRAGLTLIPFGPVGEVHVGDLVNRSVRASGSSAGPTFAGRAVDGLGHALDGLSDPLADAARVRLPAVLERVSPSKMLATGVRAIDAFMPIGRGQRIGIFSASGVGKTMLLDQIVRQVSCDRIVACLVGERGREVEGLWRVLRSSDRAGRATLVAATSDESAPMRVQAVEQAVALAEHWRNEGEDVLLVVDSATRFAMALREIGLIAGEPPTARGYTPNVFSALPRIIERCGAVSGGGSITAVFTVLSETDDIDDPLVEALKSYLDGHIVLSRRLAQAGHFPAIDVSASISRLAGRLVDADHAAAARRCRALIARYDEAQTLIESGLYRSGADPELDRAVNARAAINAFLQQDEAVNEPREAMREALLRLGGAS